MNDDIIENVDRQTNLHREIGYLEGMADAYRDMAHKLGDKLHSLERGLDTLLVKLNPPF